MNRLGVDITVNFDTVKSATDEELSYAMTVPLSLPQNAILQEEIKRRSLEAMGRLTESLREATLQVGAKVTALTTSSERLETFTKRLIGLTWALILLTIVAAVVPIGIEVWHAYHEPQTVPVLAPPAPTP
jgi:hypothetical protein